MAIDTRQKREAALGGYLVPDGSIANAMDRATMLELYAVGLFLTGDPPTKPRGSGRSSSPIAHGRSSAPASTESSPPKSANTSRSS